jgi:Outer membrane protein beta-barrel domain
VDEWMSGWGNLFEMCHKTPFTPLLFKLFPMSFLTKTLQLLLCCLLFFVHLSGQTTAGQTEQPKKVSLGIQMGMASSDVNADRIAFPFTRVNLSRQKRKVNLSARPGLFFLFPFNATAGLEVGLNYEKGGVKADGYYDSLSMTVNTFGNSQTTFIYEYIALPILFRKRFNETGKVPIILHFGPYFGFLQTATYGFKSYGLFINPNGSIVETVTEFSFSLKEQTRKRDFGLRVQVGAERKISELATVFAYAFYSRGVRRIDDFPTNEPGDKSDGMHRAYGISMGAFFRM